MSFKTSINYSEVEDYDCSECDWSLHVEKATWTKFPDAHDEIIAYINEQIDKHVAAIHGGKKKDDFYPVSRSMKEYSNTPYVTHSASPSSLIILE